MEILFLLVGIILGGTAAWFIAKYKFERTTGISSEELSSYTNQISALQEQKSKLEGRNIAVEERLQHIEGELSLERNKVIELNSSLAKINTEYSGIEQRLREQKTELEQLQQKSETVFKNLANEILNENSRRFAEQNKTSLADILNPLGERIKDFEKKVSDVHVSDTRERASLQEQIRFLTDLNQQVSKEANNLTNALKGQAKTQGNWGEFILERVLEKSGLTKGREYTVQSSMATEDGRRLQPDVIINLPENKHLVIDSKVSLVAYERYCNAETSEEKNLAMKEHLLSIRSHIKNLSGKSYQNLYQLTSLDFVLLFIPIEPAFNEAVNTDITLYDDAFEKNIVIISTSTLLATLRTIANIWKQENQNKNVLEIAKQAGDLYDKFVGFIDDMTTVGKQLDSAKDNYTEAMKKLSTGSGNIVKRFENIKTLGAKASKSLPQKLLDRANEDDELKLE